MASSLTIAPALHCEERSDAAIHRAASQPWIAALRSQWRVWDRLGRGG